jgi:hypothetical protein
MTNELVKINASDYGLEETKAAEIKAMFLPMLQKMEDLEIQYNEVLKQEINPETCQMAKDLRIAYVKTRTGTEKIHKDLKAFYLNGGRFVDAWKNTQLFAASEKEKTLKNIEDHFENQERDRLEKLRVERLAAIKPYTEIEPLGLGNMQQEVYDNLLAGFKVAYEVRIAAEKKAEEDRLALIKAEKEEQERIRVENIRLRREAKKKEAALAAEREKIRKENEEKERQAEIERQKNATILKAQQEKADKERTELLAKAEKEREERESIQRELQRRITEEREAASKLKREAELKFQAEQKAKTAAEKAAKLAPDKEKLLNLIQAINDIPRPEIKSIEAAEILAAVNGLLAKVNQFILERANKL